jgi:hypothetical protein
VQELVVNVFGEPRVFETLGADEVFRVHDVAEPRPSGSLFPIALLVLARMRHPELEDQTGKTVTVENLVKQDIGRAPPG